MLEILFVIQPLYSLDPSLVIKLQFLYHLMSIYRELTDFWIGDDRCYS